ncbi:DsrE family protein [Magnetofaba australis]|nr:DsrE family protein [Magnetofaba australis]
MKKLWLMVQSLLLALTLATPLWASSHGGHGAAASGQSLFVNIASDDLNRAVMAIGMPHKVLQMKKIPVTLFFNAEAVRLLNKNIPAHARSGGADIHAMLRSFMQDGGVVIVCPMCMTQVGGMTADDLIEGVTLGGPDATWPPLFAPGAVVLSY